MRAIVDNVMDGIITIDGKGCIISVNPAAVRLFGYAAEEVVGRNIKMLMPEPNRSAHDGYLARYQSTGESRAIGVGRELEGLTRDGRVFPMELTVTEVAFQGDRMFVGVIRDITERKLAQDLLTRMATTDGLTGLANRRRFDEVLALEYARHIRSGEDLSLILMDVDHFKLFNDTYGHVAGDDCLRQVAQAIGGAVIRATDLAARYGGEEFACILPMTDWDGAVALAEKIRLAVSQRAIPHIQSSAADHVTVSLGVATATCDAAGMAANIVALADQQLYAAKQGGRNRHCAARLLGPHS